ncbi:putative GTP-binding nuclear protein GSP2/CNR2 [Blattamonas nauphoetae]|uniref:GTP-binding nuclear protein GSP2/CNR2 n=1 Tax=Blattamonas nauphoetae TaxID=2049346 RepID=A0ABQ9Y6L0_9EUKA|nr:putative GTP-binding nuclear protein GSP2/CNR2 [Blattamonas nauphoetae]
MTNQNSFKVILLGDGAVGKTTWIKRHLLGVFESKYISTIGVEVHPLVFQTNRGQVNLNVWDTAGQELYGGFRDGYYANADAALLIFDVTNKQSYNHVDTWYRALRRICPNIPVVLCGNKADVSAKERQIATKKVTFHLKKKLAGYVEMSSKANYNIEVPVLYLLQHLMGDGTSLVQAIRYKDPEIVPHMDSTLVNVQAAQAVEQYVPPAKIDYDSLV